MHINIGTTRPTPRTNGVARKHHGHRLHHASVNARSGHCPGSIGSAFLTALKWLGAGYLAYLGLSSLLSKVSTLTVPEASLPGPGSWTLFTRGLFIGASNPKALLFFGALFPQFIEPSAPQLNQFLILGVTFIFFELFWLTIYAITAARTRQWLQKPRRAMLFNRITGVVFLLAAGLLATTKRNAA